MSVQTALLVARCLLLPQHHTCSVQRWRLLEIGAALCCMCEALQRSLHLGCRCSSAFAAAPYLVIIPAPCIQTGCKLVLQVQCSPYGIESPCPELQDQTRPVCAAHTRYIHSSTHAQLKSNTQLSIWPVRLWRHAVKSITRRREQSLTTCMMTCCSCCRTGGAWGNGLRSIVGSQNEAAALRAIESMSASFDVDEVL